MSEWRSVVKADEVPEGDGIRVEVDGKPVAIYRVDGELYAISNLCPHAFGPLDQGFIEEGRVTCPWHGWSFPLSLEGAPNDGLPRYRLRIEKGEVQLAVPPVLPDRDF